MSQQDIHDQLQALEVTRVKSITAIDQEYQDAKAVLQAHCGELGHIYTRLPYAPTAQRVCAICALAESGTVSPAGSAPAL